MNSKRKGNAGERELCALLAADGVAVRNEQWGKGGKDNPDISLEMAGKRYHVECKRAERFNAYDAMEQAVRDANGHAIPVVMHRRNRKRWLVVMNLENFIDLAKNRKE